MTSTIKESIVLIILKKSYLLQVTNLYSSLFITDYNRGTDSIKIKEKVLKVREKLEGRSNVVMTRLNNVDLSKIDAVVELEVFRSRSEAAAFFISEGIKTREDLFDKVMPTMAEIRDLKEKVRRSLRSDDLKPIRMRLLERLERKSASFNALTKNFGNVAQLADELYKLVELGYLRKIEDFYEMTNQGRDYLKVERAQDLEDLKTST